MIDFNAVLSSMIPKILYSAIILSLVIDISSIQSQCTILHDRLSVGTLQQQKRTVSNSPTISRNLQTLSKPQGFEQQQQQQQMKSEEYENLSKTEQKNINESIKLIGQTTATTNQVIPSKEEDENSQVVFVNLSRVVSDSNNKNETIRVISNNEQLIKQGEQIPCGETNRNGEPSLSAALSDSIANRIVGGTKADPGEFPYQVRLNIKSRRGSSLCGGVIIDQRHILTAAHCVTTCSYFVSTSSIEPSSIKATIGDLRITVADGEEVIGIERVTPHKQYSACSYSHNNFDIAMLKTSKPMAWIFTKDGFGSVNRACLPQPDTEYAEGENVTVSGWGVTSEGEGSISNVLRAVDVPIVTNEECKVAYGQRVNKDHVCAGTKQGGKDSCQGDSGGPLVRKIRGLVELIGIVSFGYGCAQPGVPGVYTKVSHYIDWIQNNL